MKNRVGEKFVTVEGYEIVIIAYRGTFECDIKYQSGLILKNKTYQHIRNGNIKNPYHPSVYGAGYVGVGKYQPSLNRVVNRVYKIWANMLQRCYCNIYQVKRPTYKDCIVTESWHNFQIFAQWFEENYIEGFALDKDILVKGNKIYSPETCCFVPIEINSSFVKNDKTRGKYPVGVAKKDSRYISRLLIDGEMVNLGYYKTPEKAFQAYKQAKEKEFKKLAKLCKDIVPDKVYQALINYKIEITD